MLESALHDTTLHLIIVNDGSTKGVSAQSEDRLRRSITDLTWIDYEKNMGKGYALRQGLKHGDAPLTVYTDIDLPYTLDSMVCLIRALQERRADLMIGVRDISYYHNIPRSRKYISRILQALNRIVFGLKVADTQCGLKGMNTKARNLFMETTIDRYLFDLELVIQASRDRQITLAPVTVHLEAGVALSSVSAGLLIKELRNFARLFVRRWF